MNTTNWPTLWNGFKEDPRIPLERARHRCGTEEYRLEELENGLAYVSSTSHPICPETTDLSAVERCWAYLKSEPRNKTAIFMRANHKAKTIVLD